MGNTGRTTVFETAKRRSGTQGEGAPASRKSARARHERRHTFAAVVEQLPESVMITDRSGIIEYVNPSFEQATGYGWGDVVGKRASLLKSGKHGEAFYRDLWSTISLGDTWRGRITNKRKDGSLYETDMCISPLRDGGGTVINYVAVKRDVREEPYGEGQQVQKQQVEGECAATRSFAHDLNNLTAAIIGFTDLVMDEIPEGTKARQRLGYIRDAGVRAKELVKELMKATRKREAGTGCVEQAPTGKEEKTGPFGKG